MIYGFRTREALDLLIYNRQESADTALTHLVRTRQAKSSATLADLDTPILADHGAPYQPDTPVLPDSGQLRTTDYRPSHIDAKDAIAFAAIRMKERYDSKYTALFFKVGDLVNLRLHHGYRVPGVTSKKTGPQFVGPFRVTERIRRLAYRLDLSPTMRIHDVISVAHLEPATDPEADLYRRRRDPAPVVVVDG